MQHDSPRFVSLWGKGELRSAGEAETCPEAPC